MRGHAVTRHPSGRARRQPSASHLKFISFGALTREPSAAGAHGLQSRTKHRKGCKRDVFNIAGFGDGPRPPGLILVGYLSGVLSFQTAPSRSNLISAGAFSRPDARELFVGVN